MNNLRKDLENYDKDLIKDIITSCWYLDGEIHHYIIGHYTVEVALFDIFQTYGRLDFSYDIVL